MIEKLFIGLTAAAEGTPGIALGPCTFAYMAPILSIAFALAGTRVWYGALLLIAYAVGHCSIIALAGTFVQTVQDYLNWNECSVGARAVRIVCGVFVMSGGIYLVYTA